MQFPAKWERLFNILTKKSEQLIHEAWFYKKYLIRKAFDGKQI
jgi:hypothetical protein